MGIFLEKLIPSRLLSNIQIGEKLFTYQGLSTSLFQTRRYLRVTDNYPRYEEDLMQIT